MKEVKKKMLRQANTCLPGARKLKSIRKRFKKAKELSEIEPKFRFHDLRHTVASSLVTELNADLVTAA